MTDERRTTGNTGLAKVAVQCSADTFVVTQSLVLRINICGKIATFAKPENVSSNFMKTYIADIIPRLSKFSKQLDNLTLLTEQHWVALDIISGQKRVYIFRRNSVLLVSTGGQVERGKWEFISKNSLLLDIDNATYLLRHGFFDENILALKVDSKEEYAIFVNESKFDRELNSIQAINDFLQEKYFDKPTGPAAEPTGPAAEPRKLSQTEKENDGFSVSDKQIKIIVAMGIVIVLILLILGQQ
jgi:hypothetical protein